jgi:hypothetical protein
MILILQSELMQYLFWRPGNGTSKMVTIVFVSNITARKYKLIYSLAIDSIYLQNLTNTRR